MCAYELVGHLIQGSPERHLVRTLAHLDDISCLSLVHLHFTPIHLCPYGRHSVVHVLFHGLIQRVYCKAALSGLQ
jgi:hypothetical protein